MSVFIFEVRYASCSHGYIAMFLFKFLYNVLDQTISFSHQSFIYSNFSMAARTVDSKMKL